MLSPAAAVLPLGLDEFAARLDRLAVFEAPPLVAVAVSGGPDSLALAILADRWARRRGGEILALSVDHGLRSESADEMRRLSNWLQGRSIAHRILLWSGEKPATRIEERARAARYRLLEEGCLTAGCLHLLTGHHREDQVETHLLRKEAGSGPDGLAGMSAIRELGACRIVRPLLDVPKARLLATLAVEGQPFVSDPSNRDPAFARARLRQAARGEDRDATFEEICRLGGKRIAAQRARDALVARVVSLHPAGFAVLDPAALLSAAPDIAEQVLSALLGALGGRAYPPRRRAVTHLLKVLRGAARGGYGLGGYRFAPWRDRIFVLRDLAAAAPPVYVQPGTAIFWDQRFEVGLPADAPPLRLGYLGRGGVIELHRQRSPAGSARLPRLIHPILPGLWDEGGLLAVPALGYCREDGRAPPAPAFKPVNSLSHASFAVV